MKTPITKEVAVQVLSQIEAVVAQNLKVYSQSQDPVERATLSSQNALLCGKMTTIQGWLMHIGASQAQADLALITDASKKIAQVQGVVNNVSTYVGYVAQFISVVDSFVSFLKV
jgi:hypothetical protein